MAQTILTDRFLATVTPAARTVKYGDRHGHGLHILVHPTGRKVWRYRCQNNGSDQIVTLGTYPEVGLAQARALVRQLIEARKAGRDPIKEQRGRNQAQTFEVVARKWIEQQDGTWKPHHKADVLNRMEQEVFPKIGRMTLHDIQPQDILAVVRPIEDRSVDIARRTRQRIEAVFDYAMGDGRYVGLNPALHVVRQMQKMPKAKHRPALVELPELRAMLAKAEAEPAFPQTKAANRFMALTAMRPGEVRRLQMTQIADLDGDEPVWNVPAELMKMDRDHVVPLPHQAVEILRAMMPITGSLPYVFNNTSKSRQPLSENAVGYFLNRAGFAGRMCAHGWRSAFSTVMNEQHPDQHMIVEAALAHLPDDKIRAAYNRGSYLMHRRRLMQEWADLLLDGAEPIGDIINGRRK